MNINIVCRKRQNILQKESNMMLEEQLFFEKLENELPPVFTRNEVSKLTGGLIKPKTLSNLDALSKGPTIKIRFGKKVAYEKDN